MNHAGLAVKPPVEPMLAKLADELPAGDYLYEPKWDGFRALVFRSATEVYIQSRDARPLDRYFPELHQALLERLTSYDPTWRGVSDCWDVPPSAL